MSLPYKRAKAILRRAENDPVFFLTDVLNVKLLTPQQLDVARSVASNRRTAVTAGNAVGKTWLAARLALWFLFSHPRSKVVTTAPTWHQVTNLLWRELHIAYNGAVFPLGGQLNQTELILDDDWFAMGLSTNDSTRFQGIHAERVMMIFDEATGVDQGIWTASEGVAVGPNDRFLAIGNPTDPLSIFKSKCDSGLWNVLQLNGEQHPNVLEQRIIVPGAVTVEWIAERLLDYGDRESPLYRARVRGLWPEESSAALFPLRIIEAAKARFASNFAGIQSVGADISGRGKDNTVVTTIHLSGDISMDFPPKTAQYDVGETNGLMLLVGHLKAMGVPIGDGWARLAVDDAGIGGGVTARLMELGIPVYPAIGSQKATDPQRFANFRSEMYFVLSKELFDGEINLPDDRMLEAELNAHHVGYDSFGKIKITKKEDVVDKLGRSPDRSDALAIANWARKPRGFVPSNVATSAVPQVATVPDVTNQRVRAGLPADPWRHPRYGGRGR